LAFRVFRPIAFVAGKIHHGLVHVECVRAASVLTSRPLLRQRIGAPVRGKGRLCRRAKRPCASSVDNEGSPMKQRPRGPALTKAELRAQGAAAMASATKPIQKLPTKVVRQCGRCGEFAAVMVEPGEETPPFKCKVCDRPSRSDRSS
jgi:hypothetical protein